MIAKLENLSYKGRKVAVYDEKRQRTARWKRENELVESMLGGVREVLDVPFGTGRFLPTYAKLKIKYVGIDTSEEMLRHAYKRGARPGSLVIADLFKANSKNTKVAECVVCVRLLHLLEEKNMLRALEIVCSLARRRVVLTIQLGSKYETGSVVATHSKRKFVNAVRRLGWRIAETHTISRLGWRVARLERAK